MSSVYYTTVTSFEFLDCVLKTRRKPSSSLQFENENDVTPSVINMNKQITLSYLLSVLEYNIH